MRALQYIEFEVDHCALTYGVAPCLAVLGVTGPIKCFNSKATCQSRSTYTESLQLVRFAVPTDYLPAEIDCVPSIKTITFDPSVVSLGKNLGERATLTITFTDHRDSDTGPGGDPYISSRSYDPFYQGTYFGKFRARHPFLRGRYLRWINGELGQNIVDMETRHFVIDSFSGPSANGEYKIVAKDILKLADGERAKAPAVSNGFLTADITDVATSFTISPVGVGAEYPAGGHGSIGGKEIVSYTRSGDVFTITRAQLGTAASTHKAQDRFQWVIYYNALAPHVIIADLLLTYAGVYLPHIDWGNWVIEVSTYINRLYTAVLAQPTDVDVLISELIEQAGLSMWWDDRYQLIGMLALRGMVPDSGTFSEDNFIGESLTINEQPELRLSQVHTYFGQINPLTSLTDKSNYRSVSVVTDTVAEEDYGSPVIKEIFSRWIPALGRTVADKIGATQLARFRDPPRHFTLSVLRNSIDEVRLAHTYYVQGWSMQDETGAVAPATVQVTRLKAGPDIIVVDADEVLFNFSAPGVSDDPNVRNIIIDSDILNVNMRTAYDSLYPTPVAGNIVVCRINPGVTVGSAGAGAEAFTIGTWPVGVVLVLIVQGYLYGAGGAGGYGGGMAGGASLNGGPGTAGGTALLTTTALKVELPGRIWSGGGGGGGGGRKGIFPAGGGGGGGAGRVPGVGGPTTTTTFGDTGTTETGGAGGLGISDGGVGGAGGNLGNPGNAGVQSGSGVGGAGGAAGYSISGYSLITFGTWDAVTATFTPGTPTGTLSGPVTG